MSRLQSLVATRATALRLQRHHRLGLRSGIPHPVDLELGPLFTHLREGAVVVNLITGRVVLWNPAAERMFGWPATEAVGQPFETLIGASVMPLCHACLSLDDNSARPFEVQAVTRRGDDIRVELTFVPVEYPGRDGRSVLAMLREVSERRQAERHTAEAGQLATARDEAEQRARRHEQLVHEGLRALRRDVRRLHAAAVRLEHHTGTSADDRLARRAHLIQARAARVGRDLDALATRAGIQTGTLELHLERVNLVPVVNRLAARFRQRRLPHKLNVAVPQGLTATADAERIEQLFEALLDHAVARCPRGCWIDVDLRRPLVGMARFEVRDYGRPVSQDQRRELEAGGQTDPRLALARAIAELHGGTLSFEFPADGGVRAVATLPTQHGRRQQAPTAPAE